MNDIKKVLRLLKKEKFKLVTLVFFFLISAFMEMLGIGSLVVVASLFLNPSSTYFSFVSDLNEQTLGSILIIIFILRSACILFTQYKIWSFTINYSAKLRKNLMSRYQAMSLNEFTNTEMGIYSQRILEVIPQFANSFLYSMLKIVADIILLFSIIIYLFFVNSSILTFGITILMLVYFLNQLIVKPYIVNYGRISNIFSSKMMSTVQNGIRGIREVKLLRIENYFSDLVFSYAKKYASANIKSQILTRSVITFIELIILVSIVIYVFFFQLLESSFTSEELILSLGTFAIATVRALPAVNQVVNGINKMRQVSNSISIIYEELHAFPISEKLTNSENTNRSNTKLSSINLNNISFSYDEVSEPIINKIDFSLKINECIGIYGDSGCGKSTFINILSGLTPITSGTIEYKDDVNDKMYSINEVSNIYICSQEPFVIEGSIMKNILLSDEDPNEEQTARVINSIVSSGINLNDPRYENGIFSEVGVNGMKLSGGQRQRLCVARAIYHDKNFLLFDEPSSSLDEGKSIQMMKNISNLKNDRKGILIVSHNLPLLQQFCDTTYKLNNGKLEKK